MTNIIPHVPEVEDRELTALLPHEMVTAQHDLIEWCDKKIAFVQSECKELYDAYERAKKMKWKDKPLYNLHRSALQRLNYYQKVKGALEAGYYIVPNFPIQMFAIRTKSKLEDSHVYHYWSDHQQDAQQLPANEGEYKNPFPVIGRSTREVDGKTLREDMIEGWDEFEFPLTMAKPITMDATSRAMALKIFDQLGVLPPTRKEDPVIIGQIKLKKGYTTKLVSFMIAWHLNTNMI